MNPFQLTQEQEFSQQTDLSRFGPQDFTHIYDPNTRALFQFTAEDEAAGVPAPAGGVRITKEQFDRYNQKAGSVPSGAGDWFSDFMFLEQPGQQASASPMPQVSGANAAQMQTASPYNVFAQSNPVAGLREALKGVDPKRDVAWRGVKSNSVDLFQPSGKEVSQAMTPEALTNFIQERLASGDLKPHMVSGFVEYLKERLAAEGQ